MPQSVGGVQYIVYARDSDFNLLSEIDDYGSIDYIQRFNDVGTFTMTISKASPNAANLVRGNGLVICDADKGTVIMSGQITTIERKPTSTQDNMMVSGADDMEWLKRRLVWPAEGYYGAVITDTPIRYYRLGDGGMSNAVITTATAVDVGSQGKNGTYKPTNNTGMVVDGGLVGSCLPMDTDGAIVGTGTGYVDCPTTSLPTGNSPMGIDFLFIEEALPASNCSLVAYGTAVAHELFQFNLLTTGAVQLTIFGTAITSGVLSTGGWHHVAGAWDGTTLTLYIDGASVGTATPGAQAIPGSGNKFRIGADTGATPGSIIPNTVLIDEVAFYTNTLTAGRVTAHYNRSTAHSTSGALTQAAYDTQSGTASTLIDHYVRYNLGPHANIDRWPGNITNYARAALTMSADPVIGGTVAFAARFDNLLTLCQVVAVSGSDIGFKLVQSSVGGGGTGALTFTIYQPATKANVIFSEALGNIADYDFIQDVSTDDYCIVGGSGSGTARAFGYYGDFTSLATFGRIEGFVNYSSTNDNSTLVSVGVDEVTKTSNNNTVTVTPSEVTGMVFGVDYNIGDIITVEVDGVTITDKVREAHLTLTVQDGALWVPTIGSPTAKETNTMLKEMLKEMKRSGSRVLFLDSVS